MEIIRTKFLALKAVMDERMTRLWAGAEAEAIGEGGISIADRSGLTINISHFPPDTSKESR
jgi:hypothetical protein